jgi:hypothetical protein
MDVRRLPPHPFALCLLSIACSQPKAHDPAEVSGVRTDPSSSIRSEALIGFKPSAEWNLSEKRDLDGEETVVTARAGLECRATINTWTSLPPSPGGMMSVASTRERTVDGVPVKIAKTSVFADQAEEVEAVFVNDGRAYGRVVLRKCSLDEANAVLDRVTFSSSMKKVNGP